MADVQLKVFIDLDKDGNFLDTNEDISDFVISANWQIGFAGPYDPIARDSTLTLVLDNRDRRFSPECTTSPLYPNITRGRVVRVQTVYQGETRTMYTGWLETIQPDFGSHTTRRAKIKASGFLSRAATMPAAVPIQENKRADQIIEAILSNSLIYPPGFTGAWMLEKIGYSELGNNTILRETSDYLVADEGKSIFAFAGDNWQRGTSVAGALREVVSREYGRLYVDRSGTIRFWNRHHLITATNVTATFDNVMHNMDYAFGDHVVNLAVVSVHTRKTGAADETLGTLDRATQIAAGQTQTITFQYSDASGAKIAGRNAIAPARTTDFTANSKEDGTGIDYTSSVTATIANEYADRCEVVFANTASVDVWLQPGARIRGTKITDFGQVEISARDNDSIAAYGYNAYNYPVAVDDVALAEAIAEYIVNSRKDALGQVTQLTLTPRKSDALMNQALTLTIGDRIKIVENQTAINADYFIIGEIHRFNRAAKDYTVTWLLEQADASRYWVIGEVGFSELGERTNLGPL